MRTESFSSHLPLAKGSATHLIHLEENPRSAGPKEYFLLSSKKAQSLHQKTHSFPPGAPLSLPAHDPAIRSCMVLLERCGSLVLRWRLTEEAGGGEEVRVLLLSQCSRPCSCVCEPEGKACSWGTGCGGAHAGAAGGCGHRDLRLDEKFPPRQQCGLGLPQRVGQPPCLPGVPCCPLGSFNLQALLLPPKETLPEGSALERP
ncbi:uncharacterized protein LOC119524762 [Choloepus didactylus]|uniref:uncharacterized protein LOC119524762 n=1 Tax=Choloepus didactylus TaxID=27675 RepID=UPI00189F1787|nr:uncharacterized protein LOC119524762 [Choloepus didactylus]